MTSIPLRPGITTSSRTTSGLWARASKIVPRVGRLGDHLEIVFRIEKQAEARADDRVVIDNDDADAH